MPLTELADRPETGRVYVETVRTGIADSAANRRIRLDAIARWLQDAAYWDLVDAGWDQPAPWLLRKLRLNVIRFPSFSSSLSLATWCSGLGHTVAERRTTIGDDTGACVEAVGQWIHFDAATERPVALPARFLDVYAPSAGSRRVRVKLRHPAPAAGAAAREFVFRAGDVDPAAHVNNAAYWAVLEEELGSGRAVDDGIDVEVEHRSALLPGAARVLSADGTRWVVDGGGEVAASFVLS